MRKPLALVSLLVVPLLLWSGDAEAGLITGTFNIQGSASFGTSAITFANPASSLGPNTGDFVSFGACVGCVTMTSPLTYNPFTPGQVYTATNGGLTTTFDITSNVLVNQIDLTTLSIVDLGTATLTGFDPTPGKWVITVNQFGESGSFSATTAAVPEPASMAIFATALLGLGLLGRLRKSVFRKSV